MLHGVATNVVLTTDMYYVNLFQIKTGENCREKKKQKKKKKTIPHHFPPKHCTCQLQRPLQLT